MGTKRKSSVVISASLQRLFGYALTQDCVMVFPTQINSHPIYKIVSQNWHGLCAVAVIKATHPSPDNRIDSLDNILCRYCTVSLGRQLLDLAVYSRRSLVCTYKAVGMVQDEQPITLVIEKIETVLFFLLGFPVWFSLKFPDLFWISSTLCNLLFFTSSKTWLKYCPSLSQCYVVFEIQSGIWTNPAPVPPGETSFPYIHRRFLCCIGAGLPCSLSYGLLWVSPLLPRKSISQLQQV
jgi:hypothetical protein